jgi:hypothetical protein
VPVGQIMTAPSTAGVPEGVPLTPPADQGSLEAWWSSNGSAELLGHGPLPASAVAGESFEVETWWRMPDAAPSPVLRFELDGDRGGALERPGTPGAEWPQGTVFLLRTTVAVLATASGGDADLTVDALRDDQLLLGSVLIEPRDLTGLVTEVPAGFAPTDAVFGGVAQLAGWSGAPPPPRVLEAAPGDDVTVNLAWRALAPTGAKLKVTVQILDAAGVPVAQHDAEPADWTRPTTTWIPGEVILDSHVLSLPSDLPDGPYRVVVGLYDPGTGRRLPLESGGQDMIELTTLAVGEGP